MYPFESIVDLELYKANLKPDFCHISQVVAVLHYLFANLYYLALRLACKKALGRPCAFTFHISANYPLGFVLFVL